MAGWLNLPPRFEDYWPSIEVFHCLGGQPVWPSENRASPPSWISRPPTRTSSTQSNKAQAGYQNRLHSSLGCVSLGNERRSIWTPFNLLEDLCTTSTRILEYERQSSWTFLRIPSCRDLWYIVVFNSFLLCWKPDEIVEWPTTSIFD